MKKPPTRSGAFSSVLETGMGSESGHQLPFGQGNDEYRTLRRGINFCHGRKSTCLPCRHRHGHWHGAGGLTRSLAHQFHAAAHTELGEQRGDMEFYGALGEIEAGCEFLVCEALPQARDEFIL